MDEHQKKTVAEIDEQMADMKVRKKIIREEKARIAAEADRFGQQLLDARRALGIPDPDEKVWGQRMLKYQFGLRALAMGRLEPNFRVETTPPQLRKWLTNPLSDQPATDDDLRMLLDLIDKREQRVQGEEQRAA